MGPEASQQARVRFRVVSLALTPPEAQRCLLLCYFLFCKAFSGSDSGCRAHIDFAFRRGYFVCHVGVDEKLVGEEKKPEELRSRAWPSQGFYGSITSFHT